TYSFDMLPKTLHVIRCIVPINTPLPSHQPTRKRRLSTRNIPPNRREPNILASRTTPIMSPTNSPTPLLVFHRNPRNGRKLSSSRAKANTLQVGRQRVQRVCIHMKIQVLY